MNGPLSRLLVALVRGYQRWVSPLLPPRCRFYPSCSSYAATALQRHGAWHGSRLAIWRVLRCQPFSDGGVDEVPEQGTSRPHRPLHRPDHADGGDRTAATPTHH